jgi:uncharacterized protein
MATVIGVISDTHGLIRDEALRELSDADLILHAGDVGNPSVLDALRRIAPGHAARGNIDTGAWAETLPATLAIEAQNVRVFVLHRLSDLDFDPAAKRFAAVVFGHSHKAARELRDGVLYLNPGSAGPRRFRLPVSVARLTAEGGSVRAGIITLSS